MRPVKFCRVFSTSTTTFRSEQTSLKDHLIAKFSKLNTRDHYKYLVSKNPKIANFHRASILVPISSSSGDKRVSTSTPIPKTYFTFMQRSLSSRHYGGQLCFMGGSHDPTDADEVATALREAHEESGIESSRFTFLGNICPVIVTNVGQDSFLLSPVVVYFDQPDDLNARINKHEVEKLVDIDTRVFLSAHPKHYDVSPMEIAKDVFNWHYFERVPIANAAIKEEVTVWGITAFLAVVVSSFLNSQAPEFSLDPHVPFDPNDPNKFMYEFVLEKLTNIIELFQNRK